MVSKQYDIAVIGAGIHGAGVAQAAAAHGYSVIVLEKFAVASGTSSRSSKLIHGGLRYLETAQFGLVRECLRERSILLQIAPELVTMSPFYIPVYRSTKRRPWALRLGLSGYAVLAGGGKNSMFRTIQRSQWHDLDGLNTNELQSVFCYNDAQTDDAALTKSVMQSAIELGAELYCPAEFIHAEINQSCEVHFRLGGRSQSCLASVIINAAGPWVNQVLRNVTPEMFMQPVDYVQGAHLVINAKINKGIYYLEAPQDSRAVFVIPWKNRVLLGTTETRFSKLPDTIQPTAAEIDYLLEVYQTHFPAVSAAGVDIVDRFAGVRVLPVSSHSIFARPRDVLLIPDHKHTPHIVSLYGGKLTAYRATAERLIHRLQAVLPAKKKSADTKKIKLYPVSDMN